MAKDGGRGIDDFTLVPDLRLDLIPCLIAPLLFWERPETPASGTQETVSLISQRARVAFYQAWKGFTRPLRAEMRETRWLLLTAAHRRGHV